MNDEVQPHLADGHGDGEARLKVGALDVHARKDFGRIVDDGRAGSGLVEHCQDKRDEKGALLGTWDGDGLSIQKKKGGTLSLEVFVSQR